MMKKSIMYYKLCMVIILVTCSLMGNGLFAQKNNLSNKKSNSSDAHLHFNDSSIFRYIRFTNANFKIAPVEMQDSNLNFLVGNLEGTLDYKLAFPSSKGKRYFMMIFTGWRSNEQKFSSNPVTIFDKFSFIKSGYNSSSEVEKIRNYSSIIKQRINDSYFKKDSIKLNAFIKWVDNLSSKNQFENNTSQFDNTYMVKMRVHNYVHLGILDESSIVRFNLRNAWLPLPKYFFDKRDLKKQDDIKSNEEKRIESETGFKYKFILFSLTDNEVYESDIIEYANYTIYQKELSLGN